MPDETTQKSQPPERRYGPRSFDLSNPMAEIKFSGSPIYMLKVRDLSGKGAGVIVKSGSNFMKMIEIGQELNVRLILPRHYRGPFGNFRARVEHVSEIQEGLCPECEDEGVVTGWKGLIWDLSESSSDSIH